MKKILLIEDNRQIRENIADILRLSHYDVSVAENGKVGVEKALEEIPDLIICDIVMPVMDGYAVFDFIKKNSHGKIQPFIFISDKHERHDIRAAMELGVDDYLTKPFEPGELLASIEARLKKNESQQPALEETLEVFVDNASDLRTYIDNCDVNKYEKKIRIYTEGNRSENLFYILKGKVLTYKTNESGRQLVTDILLPGDFLGFVSVLKGSKYTESAEALENTELAVISKNDFIAWAGIHPAISKSIMQILAKSLAAREKQMIRVAYGTLREKTASALLFLDQKYKEKNNMTGIHISRETLAAIAGCTIESLVRTLVEFKNEKLINIKSTKLIIVNSDRMREVFP